MANRHPLSSPISFTDSPFACFSYENLDAFALAIALWRLVAPREIRYPVPESNFQTEIVVGFMTDAAGSFDDCVGEMTAFRRRLHAAPETAFEEHRTAGLIAERLERLPDMRVCRGVGGTGVVGILRGHLQGPCVALRADMDALPMAESSGLPHASQRAGFAHACGHDGHVACLLGAAIRLAQDPSGLGGPVKFIFQPAEEGGGGALRMIEDGVLDAPAVRVVFALHGDPALPLGSLGVCPGVAYASTDALDVRVTGRGTHAATPHLGVDPIPAGAQVVSALQSVVSRNRNPVEALVVTIGTFHGGTARNVIAPVVEMTGTIRALDENVRQAAQAAIRRVAEQTAAAYGARAEVKIEPGYPMVRNDVPTVAKVGAIARKCPGITDVCATMAPGMGGEDFSYFAQRRPAVIARLGLQMPDAPRMPSLHNPAFDFNDAAIPFGIHLHCAMARDLGRLR